MQVSLKKHGGIAVAALAIIAMVTIALLVRPTKQLLTVSPADVLPAVDTLLFAQVRDDTELQALRTLVPALESLPTPLLPASIALVSGQVRPSWVLLQDAPKGNADPYVITILDREAQPRIGKTSSPLSRASSYRELRAWADEGTFAYVDFAKLEASSALLGGMLKPDKPVLLSINENELKIVTRRGGGWQGSLSDPVTPAFIDPLLLVASADTARTLQALHGSLTEQQRLLWQTAITEPLRDMLGPEASPRYDVGSLLEGESSVQIATGSGKVKFLLETALPSAREADETAAKLQRLFKDSSAGIARETRTFENDLMLDALRKTDDAMREERETQSGWQIVILTRPGDGLQMALARSERRLILANDASALRAFLDKSFGSLASPDGGFGQVLLAAGMLDAPGIASWLKTQGPVSLPLNPLLLPEALRGRLLWQLKSDGSSLILTFSPSFSGKADQSASLGR